MVTPGASTPCWVGSISGEAAAAALWVGCGAKLKAGAVAWPAAPPKREGVPPGAVPAAPNSDKPPLGAGAENLQGGGGGIQGLAVLRTQRRFTKPCHVPRTAGS